MDGERKYLSSGEVHTLSEQFLQACDKKGLVGSTVKTYKTNLKIFLTWLGEKDLGPSTLGEYKNWVDAKYSAGAGAYTVYAVVHRLIRWAAESSLVDPNIGVELGCVKNKKARHRMVTDQTRSLCDQVYILAWDDWCSRCNVITASKYLAMSLLYVHGLRQQEIVDLLWSDIYGAALTVYGNILSQHRVVRLSKLELEAVNYLRAGASQYNSDYKLCSVIKTTGDRISHSTFYSLIKAYSRRLSISPGSILPTDFRAVCMVNAICKGCDIDEFSSMFGVTRETSRMFYKQYRRLPWYL